MIELKAEGRITTSSICGTTDEIISEFSNVVASIATAFYRPFNTEKEFDSVRDILLQACALGVAKGEERRKDELKNSLSGIYFNSEEGCDEL
ncbi:MAG: hypothetical protein J6Q61_01090 [Bacteroidales bacterium]|nr:hypothetical protein [Bacteroidales bacterium]